MEQRACYRVATHLALELFQLTLELSDGRRYPARMDDVSARGLMARTTSGIRPPIRSGDRVALLLSCPARGISLRLNATVRGLKSGSAEDCYGLAFAQPEGLEAALPSDLFGLFNRRRAPRTPLDRATQALTMAAAQLGRRAVGTWRDISLSGASISVKQDEDPGFQIGEQITLNGRFGDARFDTPLVAYVRRIRSAPGAVLYGIEFDWEHADAAHQQLTLRSLVVDATTQRSAVSQRRIAERRVNQRARLASDKSIEVVLVGEGNRRANATLCDLSLSGAGVTVFALDDPEFIDDEPMQLQFELPGGALDVIARVRRGLLIDDQVCYGLEFDPIASEDFEDNQELILAFLRQEIGDAQDPPLVAFS